MKTKFRSFLLGDRQGERIVPATGLTAQLTFFAAAAMAFLAVFALALSLASGRLANRWGNELAQSSTIRIVAPDAQREDQTRAAMRILDTTAGVAFARVLDDAEQRALLDPWFGPDLDLSQLPLPRLIEIIEEDTGLDAVSLRLRLAAEVPGAVLEDHDRWREPLLQSANRMRLLAGLSILLITVTLAAMVALAAHASLAASARLIDVLRLVGATDGYITQAFTRRFMLRSFAGSLLGTGFGGLALLMIPQHNLPGGFMTGLGLQGVQWFTLLCVPVLSAIAAFFATRAAARRILKDHD